MYFRYGTTAHRVSWPRGCRAIDSGRDGGGIIVLVDFEGVAKEIHDRQVRQFRAGGAVALDPDDRVGHATTQLHQQPGLADARLPHDLDDVALPIGNVPSQRKQRLQFAGAADERGQAALERRLHAACESGDGATPRPR